MAAWKNISTSMLLLLACAACISFCSSCSTKKTPTVSGIYVSGADVYVSGHNGANAVYWKNGIKVDLTDQQDSNATSIFVSGSDVYVAGWLGRKAVYWKNGQVVELTGDTFANAFSIFVSGTDVYVAGYDSGAVYWKNGLEIPLSDDYSSRAMSIFVTPGNEIFIAGRENNDAVYWDNGTVVQLDTGTAASSLAKSICVSENGDIIVGGYKQPKVNRNKITAAYWINGQTTDLSKRNSSINAVAASGQDVYLGGFDSFVPKYWKNGEKVRLGLQGSVQSLFVYGSDVYAAGYKYGRIVYWKNTETFKLAR